MTKIELQRKKKISRANTTIAVKMGTKYKLLEMSRSGESYDEVISRLISTNEMLEKYREYSDKLLEQHDLKAKNLLRQNGKTYVNDEEWLEDVQKTFHEIRFKDEKETYIEIPITEIIGKNLDLQLKQISTHVLKSFGLEHKSRFPNFAALHTFLNERFRFQEDEVEELSPFYDKEN